MPQVDVTPPICVVTVTPTGFSVAIRDTGSGLLSIFVIDRTNLNVTVPNFTTGTTATVTVTATRINAAQPASLMLRVTDVAGNVEICDPVIATLRMGATGRPVSKTFRGLPQADDRLRLTNGRPGVKKVAVWVNGRLFRVVSLRSGQTQEMSLTRVMRASGNVVSVRAYGTARTRGAGTVLIHDGSVT